jgi:hypothetical protein
MSFVKTNTVLLSASGVDTYTVSIPFAEALSYISNQLLVIGFTVNTGASTLNINSLGALPIYKNVSTDLAAGDLSGYNILYFSGSSFQIIGKVSTGGGDMVLSERFDGLAKITVGTTEPVAPGSGDLWVDTN